MEEHRTSLRGSSHFDHGSLLRRARQMYLPFLLLLVLLQPYLPAQNLAGIVNVTTKGKGTAQAPANNSGNEDKSQEDPQDQGQKKKKKKLKIPDGVIVAPIPISSPAIGTGAVMVGGYIFPINRKDKVSPASTVGGAYFDTDNGTHGFALAAELFMSENRYHITTIYVHGNLNYDFYGTGVEAGAAGLRVPLRQTGQIFLGEFLRRLKWRFFVGPRVIAGISTITLRTEPAVAGAPIPPDVGLQTQLTGLGFRVNRDTRINRFYPNQGSYVDLTTMFFSEALGSKYDFEPFKFTVNRYQGLTSRQVLAYSLYTCATWGEPPFYGECIYGTNSQLRGYIAGKHIDRCMAATQAEYRLMLPWRLGLVAFGGLGAVAPSVDQFRYRNLLPAGGVGLRLKLSKKYGVNLRADIAQGRDGHTFSMGIGEAF